MKTIIELSPDLVKFVNTNYLIRVTQNGNQTLKGAGKLDDIISVFDVYSIYRRLYINCYDSWTWWDRKSLKIEFIRK